jgi:hypothetical protein
LSLLPPLPSLPPLSFINLKVILFIIAAVAVAVAVLIAITIAITTDSVTVAVTVAIVITNASSSCHIHFPSSASPLVASTSFQPPVVIWCLLSFAGRLIVT